ncbi:MULTISPECIES: hypothetical protein [Pseudomonas]|uniref:Uncharacterized protein n=1 Tax=Pseudomonas cedrina TaxID=651740 RepID=A0A2S9DP13_PSECE|nr:MULTISPECIES: hypothetical protein [Pseudomonas]AVJ22212.1 hypothetical protein CLM72_10925 [Pseudomonas sp. MYb193]PRC02947.1 hypothetical protein CQ006_15300 [Pseudomonas cedrina]
MRPPIADSAAVPEHRRPLKCLRLGILAIALLSLNACSWVALAAKEGAVSATGRYGLDSFTFEGTLPAEFGMDIMPSYDPVDPESSVCQRQDLYGEWSPRYYGTSDNIPIQAQPQTFTHKVPLTYSVGLCKMRLTALDLNINARHGQQKWQQTYANGGFRIFKQLPAGAPGFDEKGIRSVNAQCSWLFQESKLYLQLSKLLTCEASGTHLQYDQLASKTVKLAIEVSSEERPTMRNRWIKSEAGWKPCLGTEKSDRCQQPPIFKTFQMNGQTCTVYPGCVE